MNDELVLSVEYLRQSFAIGRDKLDVIRDVNLQIRKGESLAIVGASGQG
ncbi:lipoprotein-releasing system ATP-binding protein LolD, partial [Acidithiobacillus sp. RW2]|nr:lipoprotein-releasing system ATP-binding protein LolD [Acidithiobacillus sulfurivorans]